MNVTCFCSWIHKSIHGSTSGSNADGSGDGYMLELFWILQMADHDHLINEHVFGEN